MERKEKVREVKGVKKSQTNVVIGIRSPTAFSSQVKAQMLRSEKKFL